MFQPCRKQKRNFFKSGTQKVIVYVINKCNVNLTYFLVSNKIIILITLKKGILNVQHENFYRNALFIRKLLNNYILFLAMPHIIFVVFNHRY